MSKITSIKRVKNDGLQAELVDTVNVSGRVNVLQALNLGDPRFDRGSQRHVWFPITIASLEMLGASAEAIKAIDALTYGQSYQLDLENPAIEGQKLAIQIEEQNFPFDEYQRTNPLKAAKQLPITAEIAKNKNMPTEFNLSDYIGQTGYFVDARGAHIFVKTTVKVKSQVKHTIVENAVFIPSTEMKDYGAYLRDADKVNTEEFAEKK